MKKLGFVVVVCCLVLSTAAFSQTTQDSDKAGAKHDPYLSYLVQGLKQFPLGYKVKDHINLVLATVVEIARCDPYPKNEFCAKLTLVTDEGDTFDVAVVASDIDLAIWLHEVRPDFGKYQYWRPVLTTSRKKAGSFYQLYEVHLNGRFLSVGDKNDSRVVRYENENF